MGKDKIFGLLGENIQNDHAPELHGMFGDPDYRLFEVSPDQLPAFVKKREFDGLSVDSCYGKKIMPLLSKTSENARKVGYVNAVIKLFDGKLYGDNTDIFGFSYLLDFLGVDVSEKYCVVLGEGGKAAAVRAVLNERGCARLETLKKSNLSDIVNHPECEILINTTDIGKLPDGDKTPVSLSCLSKLTTVIDLIFNPLKTRLLREAESRGIAAYNGIPMLVAQTKKARELFYYATIDDKYIPPVIARFTGAMLNITLIGLNHAQKSEVGEALAEKLGRKHYDLDKIIQRMYGKTPETIARLHGEAELRRTEHVASEWAGKKNGIIISAGEEIILREDNNAPLCQNGIVVFLNNSAELTEAQAKLVPIYRSWANIEVQNDGTPEEAADMIINSI